MQVLSGIRESLQKRIFGNFPELRFNFVFHLPNSLESVSYYQEKPANAKKSLGHSLIEIEVESLHKKIYGLAIQLESWLAI